MKLLAFLLIAALVVLQVSASPMDTDLGAAVKNFLVKLQQSMPCGFGDGPSLSPFIMKHDDGKSHTVQYNAPDIQFKLKIKSFKMTGLNSYEVLASEYNKETKEYKIDFKTPNGHIEAEYEIDNKLNVSYVGMKLNTKGTLQLDLKEARVIANVTFDNDSEGNLKIKAMNLTEPEGQTQEKYYYGEEVDEAMSELSELFNEVEGDLNEAIVEALLPKLNDMIKKFKTVEELTDTVIKMTGDKNSGLFGSEEPCNEI
ncbi:hypothetical protein ACFFRR_006439 [Megaselia abdita]